MKIADMATSRREGLACELFILLSPNRTIKFEGFSLQFKKILMIPQKYFFVNKLLQKSWTCFFTI